MVKKNNLIIPVLFCFLLNFAQSKKKEKQTKCSTKVEAKAPESKDGKKEPKPYTKSY
jgi:hypothetical protein